MAAQHSPAPWARRDIKRLRSLINLADRFADALSDAELRGITGDWKAAGNLSLKLLVNEFHDHQCSRLGAAEAETEARP